MKCPNCIAVDLLMSERQGIEIDCCPSCRGVWLDRGELDKFVERANQQIPVPLKEVANSRDAANPSNARRSLDDDDHDDDDRKDSRRYGDRDFRHEDRYPLGGKKKESFWGNLFDFE